MSPSPELSPQPSKPAATNQPPVEQPVSEKSKLPVDSEATSTPVTPETDSQEDGSQENAPTLHRPPMRPVRPQPTAEPPKAPATASVSAVHQDSGLASVASSTTPPTQEEQAAQAVLRQQPIPPPSEPKQYRAIGVVRGQYTSSGEEFTRGTLTTPDGVIYQAVLLGRVMSLVRNHIDLEKDHLWVVYPRTREGEKELHIQIVGVWEPETLKRQPDEAEEDSLSEATPVEEETDPGVEDGYFSIRGEVVFHAPEEQYAVVKIQQAPRKSSQKAKSFKLGLQGTLESAKTVGYFWDLNVRLQDSALVIQDGTCIGLAPPKKKSKDMDSRGSRPRRPMGAGGRSVGGRGVGRPASGGSPRPVSRREPTAKPVKRSEQSGEG